jgi:hypothetical protein
MLLVMISLGALEIKINVDPAAWQMKDSDRQLPVTLTPGQPMLPYIPLKVLLPFGHRYQAAELNFAKLVKVSDAAYFPVANNQLPISPRSDFIAPASPSSPLENRIYPDKNWEFLGTQYYRGYQIALFNLYPYRYNPISRQLYVNNEVTLELGSDFAASEAQYQANFLTPNAETINTLNSLISNPETTSSYQEYSRYRNVQPANRIIDLSIPRKMIIITDNSRMDWFAEYASWRSGLGVSNAIYSMEDILGSYPGADNAEKVRNFIIHAYQTWAASSEPLQYVILGGDDEIVPERGAYGQVGDTVDPMMPVDIYFSNLDGNWNANGNNLFGETADNPDLIPEVHIGRFPAQSYTEFSNMFRKIQYYVNNTTFSNNLAIFYGENLNMNPVTWGGDYKDDVAQYLPNSYLLQTMYQRDGTYSESGVWNAINNGAGLMNHMGHANEFFLMGQSNNTIENLQNTEYGFLYTQGCYPAAFDQRTSGDAESIAEHMVTASGGLHTFIGNTRYGWYMPGSVDGASEYYDRQFFRGLFQQNHPQLGAALTYSRLQNLNQALSDDVMRWCYYEVVLFGDPSLSVKPADPNMPLLTLDSYSFSDEDGDNDGTINPGEIIRFYPVVSNAMGWASAQNVSVRIESLPAGIEIVGSCISIPQILPGGQSPLGTHIKLQLPQDMTFGSYNVRVVIESQHPQNGQSTGLRTYNASFDITLIDNRFPWETPNGGKSAPLVGEFAPAAGSEILYLDVFGNGYYIGNNGETLSTFNGPANANINRSFAFGAIDLDGGADLAFTSRNGDIYAKHLNGSDIFSYHANTAFLFSPVLADLDGDGYNETIAGGLDGKLYVVQPNGYTPYGFPLDLGSAFHSELAAADFNDDGIFEIVAGTSQGKLFVIDGQGNIKPGFPLQLDSSISGAPTITANKKIACATATKIYIVDQNGNILATRNIDTHIAGGFALADLTGDNWGMDIVGVSLSGVLYAITDEGQDLEGFPVSVGVNFSCPPLIANLDDDPQPEILLHSYVNSVYGYNHDGSPLSGFPFITSYNGSTPGSLVDFDGNNLTKLVMGHSNGVLMLNLRRSAQGLAPWTTYRGSSLRQGSFASTGFVENDEHVQSPAQTALLQNYPNPFNPITTIRYNLAKDSSVKLEIYNLKGQKVRNLINGSQKTGINSMVWDGCDDNGKVVASGIYFSRLSVSGKTYERRMLLLK